MIVFAQEAAGGEWIRDARSGCLIWNPAPHPGESVTKPLLGEVGINAHGQRNARRKAQEHLRNLGDKVLR